jgi:hypothetical protein
MAEILIRRQFLNLAQCEVLNAWVDEGVDKNWLDAGISRGSGWAYKDRLTTRNYANQFEYPPLVYQVFEQISELLDLQDVPKSVVGAGKNGVVVSYTMSGGDVYKHKDPMEGDLHVLRCNVMTRAADAGAELFIDGKKIDVGVGDLHCYLPSNVEHYVTRVEGKNPRIMWMFGYQISEQNFLKMKERVKNELATTH